MKNTKKRIGKNPPLNHKENKNNLLFSEEGLLTVEAALALGFFLFAFLSWILILQVIRVQAKTQESLDQTVLAYSDRLSFRACLGKNLPGLDRFFQKKGEKEGPNPLDIEQAVKEAMDQADIRLIYKNFLDGGKEKISSQASQNHWIGESKIEKELCPEQNRVTLKLHYSLKLPGVLKQLGPVEIAQNASAGLWILGDDWIEEEDKESEPSIWTLPPFQRGSRFAQSEREKHPENILLKGQVFDYISDEGNPTAIYSINLFTPTYTSGEGTDPAQYTIKENPILSKLRSYARAVKKAQEDYPQVKMEDGTTRLIREKKPKIHLVLPEEGKIFESQLILLIQQIRNEEDILLDLVFEDRALVNEKGG